MAYTASVVLLDAVELATPALPVLRRGKDDRGVDAIVGAFPGLDSAWVGFPKSINRQPRLPSLRAARLGSRVHIDGSNLGGDAVTLRFLHRLLPPVDVAVEPADRDAKQLRLTLPDTLPAQTAWAAGLYGVMAIVQRGTGALQSRVWPLLLAPHISGISPNPAASAGGAVTLRITCRPQVLPGQSVTLLLADREVPAQAHATATDTLDFVLDPAPVGANQLVWLRVDGAESMPVKIDPANGTLMFDDTQRLSIT